MLWGIRWVHIHMMMIDAPSYNYEEQEEESKEVKKDKFKSFLSQLQ